MGKVHTRVSINGFVLFWGSVQTYAAVPTMTALPFSRKISSYLFYNKKAIFVTINDGTIRSTETHFLSSHVSISNTMASYLKLEKEQHLKKCRRYCLRARVHACVSVCVCVAISVRACKRVHACGCMRAGAFHVHSVPHRNREDCFS